MTKRPIKVVESFSDGTGIVKDASDGALYLVGNLNPDSAPETMKERVHRIPGGHYVQKLSEDSEFRNVALSAWVTTRFYNPDVFEFAASDSDDGDGENIVVYRVWDPLLKRWVKSKSKKTMWTSRNHVENVVKSLPPHQRERIQVKMYRLEEMQ